MSATFIIDGREIPGTPGQSILEAAGAARIYIPRLCFMKGLSPYGSCRVCTVMANGRAVAACTTPVAPGMIVENDTEPLRELRRDLIDMLFVEGNHFCMFCERSGACELQALAYRLGITAPRYPYLNPSRDVDATHPKVLLDHNRCIFCARCVRASREVDRKNIFQFIGRGIHKKLGVNSARGLVGTTLDARDAAVFSCPTGTIIRKGVGYAVPIGKRPFDREPIGTEIERPTGPEIEQAPAAGASGSREDAISETRE